MSAAADDMKRAQAAGAGEPTDGDWPALRPVTVELPAAPAFDANTLLPMDLADFVLDEADRMPCSPDYIAAALMVALGSVIGARCALKPKRRDDWIVTPNLWGGVVGDPSTKKTPALSVAFKFVDRLEAKEADRHAERMKIHEAEKAAFDARQAAVATAMKKAALSAGNKAMDDAAAKLKDLVPPEEPRQRRYKTNDGTAAKIGDILARSPGGLLVLRDEITGLLASWDKPGNEGDRAFYLEGWNGTGTFNIDRVGRGSQFVPNLCLSVFGGIQPELIQRYLTQMAGSLDNDGRVQRFQLLVYPEPVAWQWRDRYPVKRAREAVRDMFDRLASLDPVLDGAAPADEFVKLPSFSFDDDALEFFIEWATDLYRERIAKEQSPLMAQHLAKFEKLFGALALILHLAEGRVGPVQKDTAVRASAWCEYLEGHARRIYALIEVARVQTAKLLSRRLAEKKLIDGFTARDVVRKGWAGLSNSAEAEAALSTLEEFGWVRSVDVTGELGRPTTRYFINPAVNRGA